MYSAATWPALLESGCGACPPRSRPAAGRGKRRADPTFGARWVPLRRGPGARGGGPRSAMNVSRVVLGAGGRSL